MGTFSWRDYCTGVVVRYVGNLLAVTGNTFLLGTAVPGNAFFGSVLFWWEHDMPVPPSAAPGPPKYAGIFWAVRGTPKNAGTFSVGMRHSGTAYLGSPEYVGTFSAVQKYSGSSKFFQ